MKDSNINHNTSSKWSGRKVVFTFCSLIILVGAFLLIHLVKGPISDMQFMIFCGGVLASLGIYGGTNVTQKAFEKGMGLKEMISGRNDENMGR